MIAHWGHYTKAAPVWQGIPGFFDFADVYDEIAAWAKDGYTLVEVGSLLGRSACYLGEKLQAAGTKATLLCVDTWPGVYSWTDDPTMKLEAPFETFYANVRQSGLLDIVVPLRLKSVRAAALIKDGLDFVFIDAAHDYQSVLDDIRVWLPKVRSGGILSGHDYSDTFPGVVQSVREVLGDKPTRRGQCWVYPVP